MQDEEGSSEAATDEDEDENEDDDEDEAALEDGLEDEQDDQADAAYLKSLARVERQMKVILAVSDCLKCNRNRRVSLSLPDAPHHGRDGESLSLTAVHMRCVLHKHRVAQMFPIAGNTAPAVGAQREKEQGHEESDDSEDEWSEDDDVDMPVDHVDVFVTFAGTLRSLQATNPARFQVSDSCQGCTTAFGCSHEQKPCTNSPGSTALCRGA